MKKLTLVLTLFVGWSMFAQPAGMKKEGKPEFTPEQHAELRTKQLALALDLNEKQMTDIKKLELSRAKEHEKFRAERKEFKEGDRDPNPDANAFFEQKNARLDREIQHQQEMKRILTPEQFEKWQKMREDFKRKEHKSKEGRGDRPHLKGEKMPPRPIEEP